MHKIHPKPFLTKLNTKGIVQTLHEYESEFFLVFTILITTTLLIFFLTHYIILEKDNVIDYNIFLLVGKIVNPAGIRVAKMVTLLGTGNFLIPAYIFVVIYLEKRNYRCLAYLTAVTAVSSLLLGWILKWIFHRQRPLHHLVSGAGGYGFPSGHALGGFVFCGMLLYLIWQSKGRFYSKWALSVLVVVLGFCIGFSRIYLHVHYATDVLGSLFIAIWWLSFMHILFRLVYRNNIYKTKERHHPIFYPNEYYINN